MFTATLAFLNTPVFNFAAPRFIGASLLFIAGPTLAYQQQQMQGTQASLNERRFKVLQISLGVAGIFFAWGVPFTTTLPLALTYALFLIISGLVGLAAARRKDPNLKGINEDILKVSSEMREHLGLDPNMGYQRLAKAPETPPDINELDWNGHSHEWTTVYKLPTMETESADHSYIYSILHQHPDLLPSNQESTLLHVDEGSTLFVKRAGKVLPEKLPEEHTVTQQDIEGAQRDYEGLSLHNLNFLIDKEVQHVDDLGNLIVAQHPELFNTRHQVGAALWRRLCEQYLYYAEEVAHPFDPRIIVKTKSA